MPSIYNPSTTVDIEIDDLGITIHAQQIFDITYIRRLTVVNSEGLRAAITSGDLAFVLSDIDNVVTTYSVADGLEIIDHGVSGTDVGINKPTRPGIVEGNFYGPSTDAALINDVVPADHLNAIPVNYMNETFNRIGICVTTAVANTFVRLGVYGNNNGAPGELLLDAGVVPCDTAGNKEIVIDFTTPNDWIFVSTHTSGDVECKSVTGVVSVFGNIEGDIENVVRHLHTDLTYDGSGLPEEFPAYTVSSNYPPFVWFRKL
jgi:hypothetical protein